MPKGLIVDCLLCEMDFEAPVLLDALNCMFSKLSSSILSLSVSVLLRRSEDLYWKKEYGLGAILLKQLKQSWSTRVKMYATAGRTEALKYM